MTLRKRLDSWEPYLFNPPKKYWRFFWYRRHPLQRHGGRRRKAQLRDAFKGLGEGKTSISRALTSAARS